MRTWAHVLPIVVVLGLTAPAAAQEQRSFPEFLLMMNGQLERSGEAITVKKVEFFPIVWENAADEASRRKQASAASDPEKSVLELKLIEAGGKETVRKLGIDFVLPGDDIMQTVHDRVPPGKSSFHGPIALMSPRVRALSLVLKGKEIWRLERPAAPPKIVGFSMKAGVKRGRKGVDLGWGYSRTPPDSPLFVNISYRATKTKWNVLMMGKHAQSGSKRDSFFLDDEGVQTTLGAVTPRVMVCDGFHAVAVIGKPSPIGQRPIELYLTGLSRKKYWLGQNIEVRLMWVDPETGVGCDGEGCTSGPNKGLYDVTWESNLQTIAPDEIHRGLTYFMKKEGKHEITVRVQHKRKKHLRGEGKVTFVVVK